MTNKDSENENALPMYLDTRRRMDSTCTSMGRRGECGDRDDCATAAIGKNAFCVIERNAPQTRSPSLHLVVRDRGT